MSESSNTQQYTVNHSNATTSSFKLPGEKPGEEPFSVDSNFAQEWVWYVHIDNGWNANADITLEGSHSLDDATNNTLDSPAADGSTITVNAGATDFIDGSTLHSLIQVDVAPATDPTSGDLTVVIEKRKP